MERRARFIVIAGPPCAGKSTLARKLSLALQSPHLEMDSFRQRVLPQSDQGVADRDIAYRAMHFAAELMVPWCDAIVLDATYTAAPCRTGLLEVIERVGGELFVLECHVDAATVQERFARRGIHPAVDLAPDRVAVLAQKYPYCDAVHAVGGNAQHGVDLGAAIECLATPPLDASDRAEWCERGQPREAARDELSTAHHEVRGRA